MCVAGLGADVCSLVTQRRKAKRIREQLRQTRLPAPALWRESRERGDWVGRDECVQPLTTSRSHDTLASKRVSTQRDSDSTAAQRTCTTGSPEANRHDNEISVKQAPARASTSGIVPSRSLVDVAAAVAGRPVSAALNWSARLERRALKAQLSDVQHKRFAKRLSLHKNIFDLICATNTAYGSGLIFMDYTDLVIGLAGFYSSVLGAYRAWLIIFPRTLKSQEVSAGHGLRSSLLRLPRPVAETPLRRVQESKLSSVAGRAPSLRKLSRAASGTRTPASYFMRPVDVPGGVCATAFAEGELPKLAASNGAADATGRNAVDD